MKQKQALKLVAISVALLGCFSVQTVADEPVKIMPLGDSITRGVGTLPRNGYRKPLYLSLISGGYNVDFVGSQTSGDFNDPNHEGHNSWHADTNGPNDILGQVYNWLTATPADIVLLHIGRCDITAGEEDANEIGDILDEIDRYEADSNEAITVILALIIDRQIHNPATTQFNIDVNNMAQNRIAAGDDIIVVDMEHALNYETDMYDDLHPNGAGYAKMANVWYNAFDDCLTAQRTLTCSSTIGGSVIDPGEGPFVYDHGTDVNLIASVDPDYYFANWTGTAVDAGKVADPDANSTTVLMDASYTVVANFAANHTWDDGADPCELWSEPNNWDPDGIPTIADSAVLNVADACTLIDSTVNAQCSTLTVGYDTGPCYLNMTGGNLTMDGLFYIGDEPDGNGIFILNDGNVSTGDAKLQIGYGKEPDPDPYNPTYGTFIMTGGDVNVGSKLNLGENDYGTGWLHMYGGALTIGYNIGNEDLEIGKHGKGYFYIYDGNVNVDDTVKIGAEQGDDDWEGTSYLALHGGYIYCDDLFIGLTGSTMDITEGEIEIESDEVLDRIQGYINDGRITGYGGAGYAVAELYGGAIHVTARMTDPNLAWDSYPDNYETVQWTPAGPTLTWKAGRYAADVNEHDVYFGTDEEDVNDANNSPGVWPEFQGNQDPCSLSFPTPPPVLGQTYYWRIDEVNDARAPYLWKGVVWEFKIADYLDVEDFDSYANETALETVWNLTGSDIDLEDTIVCSGKSMKYEYDNSPLPHYTEADAYTTGTNSLEVVTQDWTKAGLKALVLYFYGNGGNDAEKMYVALEDTANNMAAVYYDDPNDLNEPEWHEWNIELSDFNETNDVNLSSIDKVYIGFGDRENPAASYGGEGTVYFDDIRLYPTRCVPVFGPAGDISATGEEEYDCYVDFYDVDMMEGDWLEMDYNGVGRDGELKGGASWVNDAQRGRCVQLDGIDDWVDLDDRAFSNFRNKTIAFWVKILDYPQPYRHMFFFTNEDFIDVDEGETPYRIYFMTKTQNLVNIRFVDGYSTDYSAAGIWHHLAFTVEDTDEGSTSKFYADGIQVQPSLTDRPRHSGRANGVNLGSEDDGDDGFVKAVFDDFRVYDYALSGTEILALYNATKVDPNGTAPDGNMMFYYDFDETSGSIAHNSSTYEFYHPLLSDAELYDSEAKGSRAVNFRDFTILANDWLKGQLWP